MLDIFAAIAAQFGQSHLDKKYMGTAGKGYASVQKWGKGSLPTGASSSLAGTRTSKALSRKFMSTARKDVWKSLLSGYRTGGFYGAKWGAMQAAHTSLRSAGYTGMAASKMAGKFAMAAGGSMILGAANVYLMWGMLPSLAVDATVGGFNALADIGKRARETGPSTSARFVDTRQAYTMRQAGVQAIQEAGMAGYRNRFGGEAGMAHR